MLKSFLVEFFFFLEMSTVQVGLLSSERGLDYCKVHVGLVFQRPLMDNLKRKNP